jgi:hypothetical protein
MVARINRRKAAWAVLAVGIMPVVGVGVAKWAGAADVRPAGHCLKTGPFLVGANGQSFVVCTLPFGPDPDVPAHALKGTGPKLEKARVGILARLVARQNLPGRRHKQRPDGGR